MISREGYAPVEDDRLFYREIGQGQPIIVIHGGPDFDHRYLLPDMDRLADSYRLIYYDQRGRGGSLSDKPASAFHMQTEIDDIEGLRRYLGLDHIAVLGHSWGGLLAMQYAIQYPDQASHLILLNTAPASQADYFLLRDELKRRKTPHADEINTIKASAEYRAGEPDVVTAYYRIHYGVTIQQPEHLESVLRSMRASFTSEGILRGREIEDQLYTETWLSSTFDYFPALAQLRAPTLIIHGEHDFVPVKCAEHIAQTIPGAQYVLIEGIGHFSYVEAPEAVRAAMKGFLRGET